MNLIPTASRAARRGAIIGLVAGLLYSVGGLVVDLLTVGLNEGTAMAFGALLGLPVIFGAAGFVLGIVGGLIRSGVRAARTPGEDSATQE